MLLGRLVIDDSPNHQGIPYNNEESGVRQRGRFRDLLRPAMRKTSLLLWFIWMSCAFCYYGLVLMTTELFETSAANCKSESQPNSSTTLQVNCAANCRTLQTTDYMDLLWTTLAEFPGTLYNFKLNLSKYTRILVENRVDDSNLSALLRLVLKKIRFQSGNFKSQKSTRKHEINYVELVLAILMGH